MLQPRTNPAETCSDPQKILVFGCGYLGFRVATTMARRGHQVWGTTRHVAKAQSLRETGIEPIIADWNDRRTLCSLPEVDRILVSVSRDRGQAGLRRSDQIEGLVDGFRNLLQAVGTQATICYISTTGVYHQTDGRWVDETSPTRPSRSTSRAHLLAENLLRRLRPQSPWTILRLAGIYGPGRIPRITDILEGRPIESPTDGYLNLIRVEDAAEAVIASWSRSAERVYLVSDDRPVLRHQYYRYIARLFGAPEPKFVAPQTDTSERLRSTGNKRVWNRRMKRDLVPRLQFPTYREGLTDLL